jgi:hypothetical protein
MERGLGLISFAKRGFGRIYMLGDLAAWREKKNSFGMVSRKDAKTQMR